MEDYKEQVMDLLKELRTHGDVEALEEIATVADQMVEMLTEGELRGGSFWPL